MVERTVFLFLYHCIPNSSIITRTIIMMLKQFVVDCYFFSALSAVPLRKVGSRGFADLGSGGNGLIRKRLSVVNLWKKKSKKMARDWCVSWAWWVRC